MMKLDILSFEHCMMTQKRMHYEEIQLFSPDLNPGLLGQKIKAGKLDEDKTLARD